MAKLTEHELLSLTAHALHHSGPDGNPERMNLSAAYTRAAAVVIAMEGAGAIVIREERRFRRPWVTLDADAVDADEAG
jgi:hypothetical protein